MTPLFQQVFLVSVMFCVLFCFIGIPYIEDKFGVAKETPEADTTTATTELPAQDSATAEVIDFITVREELAIAA